MPKFALGIQVVLGCLLAATSASLLIAAEETDKAEAKDEHAIQHPDFTPAQLEFFEKEVQPILSENCWKCHGEKKQIQGKLFLTSRAGILTGGDSGPAVDLEAPGDSILLSAINYELYEMPPTGKLPDAKRATLTKWVEMGLPFPKNRLEEPRLAEHAGPKITEEDRNYWAYRDLQRPATPEVKNKAWVRNDIDRFILAKLEAAGIAPVDPADKAELCRRVYYDLVGLPPTPEQLDAFVKDDRPDAYERLLDDLMESPHYGEKWGRHWLDLVRYAETNGYERDAAKPFAWRYRDYVIRSFNEDKPYDQFIKEQLAGDLLPQKTLDGMIATGYYRLGIWNDEPVDRAQQRYDVLDDVVSTTSQVFLGMTLGCARCHDHKGDPILQKDYYQMVAFFNDITDMDKQNTVMVKSQDIQEEQVQLKAKQQREAAAIYAEMFQLEQQFEVAAREKLGTTATATPDLSELTYKFYRDTWKELPADFDGIRHETEGEMPGGAISLRPASRKQAIGLVFDGVLRVPADGKYTFRVNSVGGVRLKLADKTAFDLPKSGQHDGVYEVELSAGMVPLRLEYFNAYDDPAISLTWESDAFKARQLTTAASDEPLVADARSSETEWAYITTQPPEATWNKVEFKDAHWARSKGGFGASGTPGAIVRTDWRTDNIWLRRTFSLSEIPAALKLSIHHDEDAEVYLNGHKIAEFKGYLVNYRELPLEGAEKHLKLGENVLAVHCHQTGGGQYIDVGLSPDQPSLEDLIKTRGEELVSKAAVQNYFRLADRLTAVKNRKLPEGGVQVMAVEERGQRETFVLIRGNVHAPADKVTPGYPTVLDAPVADSLGPNKRLVLAEWITDKQNPLTARVMMNRVWQHHFGRGIVPTPNDFGKLGQQPTHPELLNYLADEFMAGDWKLKRMHKLMMTSSTYLSGSQPSKEALAKDPANELYWRMNMRRLTAEEVRDTVLSVSGELNDKQFGPSVYVKLPQEVLAGQSRPGEGWGKSPEDEQNRRSIYVHVKRSLLVPILINHDLADTDASCAARYVTTVPTQALNMLNGEFMNDQAKQLADRLREEAGDDLDAQITLAIRLASGRQPDAKEVAGDRKLIEDLQKEGQSAEVALQSYCLMILNSNELVFLD